MLAAKKTRSIAVSNFDTDQLACITQNKSATVPAVNQLSYSVGSGDPGIAANAAAGGILVQAYSPLGGELRRVL
jgi:diketogulonate reductase-like aldo/keto reductase